MTTRVRGLIWNEDLRIILKLKIKRRLYDDDEDKEEKIIEICRHNS